MKPWEKFTQDKHAATGPWNKFGLKREDLPQISPNTDPQYSALEKAVYTGRAGAEGLLFGLGDVLAGATNTVMSPLAKTVNALKEGTPLSVQDFNPVKNFQEGRGDFVREQEEFKKVHPGLNAMGELAGGLLGGGLGGAAKSVAGKGLLRTAGQGAKEGAKWGGLFGAGQGLTDDADRLNPVGALEGGIRGAVLGAPFGAAFGLAGAGINKAAKTGKKWIANYKNKDYNTVAKAAGEDVLQKSIDTQTPLLDIGNSKVAQLAKDVKNNNVEASDLLTEFVEQGYAGQGDKLRQIVGKYMPATGAETAETLTAAKRALSEAAYKPMQQMGALLPKNPGLAKLVASNPQIKRAMLTAKRNLPQLGDDGFNLFNETKKVLDDMAMPNPLASGAEKSRIRYAQQARSALIDELDKATGGQYKKALQEYGDLLGAEQALSRGRELMNMDPQAAAAIYRQAGASEREALRVGLAQELQRRIRKGSIDGSARNLASTLVGSEQNKQIFRSVLGKDADKFIEELSGVNRAVKNYGIVKGGSDTHSNNMRAEELADLLFGKITALPKIVAGKIIGRVTGRNPQEVAKMMTDPGYLAAKRWAAMQRDINVARRVGKVHFDLLRAGGPLVKKGEDPVRVNHNSWDHIKKSPDPHSYDAIQYIRDIHANGAERKNVENYKRRGDNFTSWDYYQKREATPTGEKEMLVSVGNTPEYRELHNINPNVEEFLQKKFPWFSGKLDPDMPRKKQGGIFRNTPPLLNSITKNRGNVKPVSMRDFMRVLLSPQFGGIAAQVGEGADKKASKGWHGYNPRPMETKTSVAGDPSTKRAIAKGNNSIANKQPKNKTGKNALTLRDLIILLNRPFTLGAEGNIVKQNLQEGN